MNEKRPKSDVRRLQAQIAVRLLPEESARVQQIAQAEGTSAAAVLRRALHAYFADPTSA